MLSSSFRDGRRAAEFAAIGFIKREVNMVGFCTVDFAKVGCLLTDFQTVDGQNISMEHNYYNTKIRCSDSSCYCFFRGHTFLISSWTNRPFLHQVTYINLW